MEVFAMGIYTLARFLFRDLQLPQNPSEALVGDGSEKHPTYYVATTSAVVYIYHHARLCLLTLGPSVYS